MIASGYHGSSASAILRNAGVAFFLGSVLLSTARKSEAATITVTNLNDSGAGSLRQAVLDSNASIGVRDTIDFETGLTGTITLTSGQMLIADTVSITGPGASVITISGNNNSRIFYEYSPLATPITATISGLTLIGGMTGDSGGAVRSYGEDLTLRDCTLSGNGSTSTRSGGALSIARDGRTLLDHCILSDNTSFEGGAVSASVLTISNTIISENSAINGGGGVSVGNGKLIIDRSTISLNNCVTRGGGISQAGTTGGTITNTIISGNTTGSGSAGGGVYWVSGTLYISNSSFYNNQSLGVGGAAYLREGITYAAIRNCTIHDNYARIRGGGIDALTQNLTVSNSTVSGNRAATGGGIYVTGTFRSTNITLQSTIVSGNTDNAGQSDVSRRTLYTSGTYFIINASNCLIEAPASGAINGTNTANIIGQDPLLGPLQNNGGMTLTRELLPGSPALDTGSNPAGLATDQRGAVRTSGSGTDIGAVERDLSPPTAVLSAAPGVDGVSNPTQYDFTITFSDDFGLVAATFDNADILVTGPNGFSQMAQLVSVTPAGNGSPRTVTYRIFPPGGTWDLADTGVYSIAVLATQVSDTGGNFIAASVLGTFSVDTSIVPQSERDTDGDGFSDGVEAVLGSDLRDPESRPFNLPVARAGGTLSVKRIRIELVGGSSDELMLDARATVRPNFPLAGQIVILDIGGVIRAFRLDANGRATSGNDVIEVRLGRKRQARINLNLRGALRSQLADENLTNTGDRGRRIVRATLLLNSLYYSAIIGRAYSPSLGRFGR